MRDQKGRPLFNRLQGNVLSILPGISISPGIVRAIRHTRAGFCFFYASGDLRENIALTMAFWRAWHARGTARETEPRGKMTDGEFEERERIWGI